MRHGCVAVVLAAGMAVPAAASVEAGQARWKAGDYEGAVAQWAGAAARGDAEALFNMGQAYRLGRGVPQSSANAIDYYRRAAEKGHVAATTNLGITLYQEGRKTEALNQLRQAADKGDLRASYVLGVATFGGDGTQRNAALGYGYVLRARDGGLAVAGPQATRMEGMMAAADVAQGRAAAAALASGKPVAVVLAELAAPRPAPEEPQVADAAAADEDSAEAEAAPSGRRARVAESRNAGRDAEAVEVADATVAALSGASQSGAPQSGAQQSGAGKAGRTGDSASATGEPKARAQAAKAADGAAAGRKAESAKEKEQPGWKVQLGAYANEGAARTAWATLVSQSASLLKGRKPIYSARGNLVRLQVGPYPERGDAAELCTKLAAAGRPCFVTR